MRRVAAIATCVACGACAQHVVWYGRTPDHLTRARVVERGGAQRVVVGTIRDAAHEAVGVDGLVLARDARAYPALDAGRWSIVRDGAVQPGTFDAIGDVRLSPDGVHLAFAALMAGSWSVRVDGVAGPTFTRIERRSLEVRNNGHVSYVGQRPDGIWVIDGARAMGPYEAIRGLRRQGDDLEWVARVRDGEQAVCAGRASETFDEIVEWAPRAWIGRRARRWVVETEGRRAYDGAAPASALSVRGSHHAYALDASGGELLVVDGEAHAVPFDAIIATTITSAGRACFIAARGGSSYVVADPAEPSGPWDAVGPLATAATGDHLGFVAHRGDDAVVVIDGVERGVWASATLPVFSSDGSRWAYIGSMGAGAVLVDDGGRKAFDVVLTDTLAFDARGRAGAVVGFASNRSVWIAIDRAPRVRVDLAEWVAEVQRAGMFDGRAWVEAELARLP